jgi:hypothetical protein
MIMKAIAGDRIVLDPEVLRLTPEKWGKGILAFSAFWEAPETVLLPPHGNLKISLPHVFSFKENIFQTTIKPGLFSKISSIAVRNTKQKMSKENECWMDKKQVVW